MKTKLILIGGVPGTGKTTVAYQLALKLKIDKLVSIDMIKAMTRAYSNNFGKYVFTTTHEAYKLENISVIEGFLKHSREINKIALDIVNQIKDNVIIIEGATINKEMLNVINKDKYEFVYINLVLDYEELVKRYEMKNKLRKGKWLDNIVAIKEINEYLKKDNFNINNNYLKDTVERIVEYVKENLCL